MRIILGAVVLACLIGLCIWVWYEPPLSLPPLYGVNGEEIVLTCSLPQVSDEMPRLRVIEREISEENVRSIAEELFGFTGEVREYEGDMWVRAGSRTFQYYYTGDFRYIDFEDQPTGHLTDEEAREIADAFMENVKALGLTPQNPHLKIEPTGEVTPSMYVNGHVTRLRARFRLMFDDFEIWGAGASVEVGLEGGILGFWAFWRDIEEEGTVSITVTPMEALESLASESPWTIIPMRMWKVIIEQIDLTYFCESFGNRDYLHPIYLFTMTLLEWGGDEYHFSAAISAIDEPEVVGPHGMD